MRASGIEIAKITQFTLTIFLGQSMENWIFSKLKLESMASIT